MAGKFVVGSAWVALHSDDSAMRDEIPRQTKEAVRQANAGAKITPNVDGGEADKGFAKIGADAERSGKDAGDRFATRFADAIPKVVSDFGAKLAVPLENIGDQSGKGFFSRFLRTGDNFGSDITKNLGKMFPDFFGKLGKDSGDSLRTGLSGGLITSMADIEAFASKAASAIGGGIASGLSSIASGIGGLAASAASALPIMAAWTLGILAIGGIVAALAVALNALPAMLGVLGSAFTAVLIAVLPVVKALGSFWQAMNEADPKDKAKDLADFALQLGLMSPEAAKLTQWITGLWDVFQKLSNTLQTALFGPVVNQMDALNNLFGLATPLLTTLAGSVGTFIGNLLKLSQTKQWQDAFQLFITTSGPIMDKLGEAVMLFLDTWVSISPTVMPFLDSIAGLIRDIAQRFDDWFKTAQQSGELKAILDGVMAFLTAAAPLVPVIFNMFLAFFDGMMKNDALPTLMKSITDSIVQLTPYIPELAQDFTQLLIALMPLITSGMVAWISSLTGVIVAGTVAVNFWKTEWANTTAWFSKEIPNIITNIKNWFNDGLEFVKRIWNDAWGWLTNIVGGWGANIQNWAVNIWHWMEDTFNNGLEWIKGVWDRGWGWLKSRADQFWTDISNWAMNVWNWLKSTWDGGIEWIKGRWGAGWQWMADKAAEIHQAIENKVNQFITNIKSAFSNAVDGIRTVWTTLQQVLKDPINFMIDPVYSHVRSVWNTVVDAVGLKSLDLPAIAKFAAGGEVPNVPGIVGDRVPILATAGERVLSLNQVSALGGHEAIDKMFANAEHHDIGGIVGNVVSGLAGEVKHLVQGGAAAALSSLKAPITALASQIPGKGGFADAARAMPPSLLDKLISFIATKDQAPAGLGLGGSTADSVSSILAVAKKFDKNAVVSSGTRPGATGPTGNKDYHNMGMAADLIGNMTAIAEGFYGIPGSLLEEIHAPSWFVKNGNKVGASYYGADVVNEHYNHVHIAARKDAMQAILTGQAMGGTWSGSGNVGQWIQQAMKYVNIEWPAGLTTLIDRESAGNPNAINLTDSNAAKGQPSRGLMQVIPDTFQTYRDPRLPNNAFDPIANIVAGMNYIHARYGSLHNVPQANADTHPQGYWTGTPSAQQGWAKVGEHGSEWVNFGGGEQVLRNGQSPGTMVPAEGDVYLTLVVEANKIDEVTKVIDMVKDIKQAVRAGKGNR